MFDMHYDLLTAAYIAYLKNDFQALKDWCLAYNNDNVKGLIANLYFMSKQEMKEELHPKYYQENVSVTEMFKIAKEIVEFLLPDTEIIYSIEGCDYLEVADLEELYRLGLRSILPVWNEQNQYASGNRSNEGLTEKGKKLIDKAVTLGMAIDLSHANVKSFYDIINYLKIKQKEEYNPIVYASHSNSRLLCNRDRNLYDEQIKALKDIGGMIGIFSNRNFIVPEEKRYQIAEEEKKKYYLQHINHVVDIIGIDYVGLSTDDMNFCSEVDSEYKDVAIYNYKNIKKELIDTLSKNYSNEDIDKILYFNMKNNYDKLVNNNIKRL